MGRGYATVEEVKVSEEQSERGGEKPTSILHQWDATSLITCAKFQLEGRLRLDYVLDVARIVGSWLNGMKLNSHRLPHQLTAQVVSWLDHEEERF